MFSTLPSLLDHLYTLHGKNIDLGFERLIVLLNKLGNPHLKLPPTLHIAGTNGKGSTTAFCQSILKSGGYKVHTYTSPHLIKFNERICLNGQPIEDEHLFETLKEIIKINDEQSITFFEATTAAAFFLFSKIPADFVLLETGLGGRLDATNVLSSPLASLITPISYDHQEFLGNRLEEIAFEKAGIIKPSCPVIISQQPSVVLKVLKEQAILKQAPMHIYGEDWDLDVLRPFPPPKLQGDHQRSNAAMAIKTLQTVTSIKNEAISKGLTTVEWPGRMQLLQKDPFEIWLDSAHNPAGAETLAHEIRKWSQDVPVFGIIGMKKRKDALAFLKILKSVFKKIYTITLDEDEETGPSYSSQELSEIAASINLPSEQSPSYSQALSAIRRDYPVSKCVLAGSLYLTGKVLKTFRQ